MLRILPLADDLILPQARQEICFFNRIGQKRSLHQYDINWPKQHLMHPNRPPSTLEAMPKRLLIG
jgi:hypothetical protein